MKSIKNSLLVVIILIFSLTIFYNCFSDQVEKQYPDFYSANQDGLFRQGWIPSELVFQSMTDIFQQTNLDINSCIFNYNLSNADVDLMKNIVQPTSKNPENLRGISMPSDWLSKVEKLDHYIYVNDNQSDTIFIAIDFKNNKIFGWRSSK